MVYVFLADGFEEVEALTPIDYMRRAGIEVKTVGVGTTIPTGSHGVKVMTDISEDTFYPKENVEAVVLPGGKVGVQNLSKSETVRRAIRLGIGETDGIVVAAICAAPSILAKEGLLKQNKATCHPTFVQFLGDSYADEDVVLSKPYLTGRAAGVSNEFALALVERLRGKEARDKVAAAVCFNR